MKVLKLTEEKVRKALNTVAPATDWFKVSVDENLEDAGLDSLDKANFIMEIESSVGFVIDDSDYENIKTMQDILDLGVNPSR